MITKEELIKAAKILKEYCNNRDSCLETLNEENCCPFYSSPMGGCVLCIGSLCSCDIIPGDWDIKED